MKTIFTLMFMALTCVAVATERPAETFTIEGSKGKLHMELERPDGNAARTPLVIICHGFSGNSNEPLLTDIADDLRAKGIASLRFDFNGHGKSEGEFKDMTVPNEIADLKAVVDWARSQAWVDGISLLGHSQGGVVAAMTAGQLGDGIIKNLVLMAPAAVLRDDALRGNTMGAVYDPHNLQADYVQLPYGGLKLGRKYIETAITLPIYETAALYKGPVLVIHGTYDRVVPYTYSERFRQVYEHATLILLRGDDHGFTADMPRTAALAADRLAKMIHSEM